MPDSEDEDADDVWPTEAMAILKSSCCCCSIRQGSFASGIYTAVLYALSITLIVDCNDITSLIKDLPLLGYWFLILPSLCVLTSLILLVGICVSNPILYLPWLVMIITMTILEICVTFYKDLVRGSGSSKLGRLEQTSRDWMPHNNGNGGIYKSTSDTVQGKMLTSSNDVSIKNYPEPYVKIIRIFKISEPKYHNPS
ncbi:hypothetical protein GQR58_002685 [Nymphon striatum]|nr:hypothetical protein GQR58_002685 [Nymphon striatum]